MRVGKWRWAAVLLGMSSVVWAANLATAPTHVPADQPAAKLDKDGKIERRFAQLHEEFMARRADQTGLLFIGASIMERWRQAGKAVYAEHYGRYAPDDFGVSGDQTQNVLWRIDQGELDGMHPKVVVLQIGNNNLDAGDTVDVAVAGVAAVVKQIRAKLPETKVLLISILPRGADPENPKVARMRAEIRQANAALAKLGDGRSVRFLDFGETFLDPDGVIRYGMMDDATHPTAKGYAIWAAAMDPVLAEMMK